jgi:zinc protease
MQEPTGMRMTRIQKSIALLTLVILVIATLWFTEKPLRDVSQAPVSTNGLTIESWHTKNGARVLFVEAPQLPMVDVRIVFDAGSARDKDKPGLASLTNAILDQGAGEWDTNTLAERFDSVGAQCSNSTARDMAVLQLRSLTEAPLLDKAVSTMAAIVNQPRFKQTELERLRKQVLISLKNQQQSPGQIADKAFYQALFNDHPYATPTLGEAETVAAISRDDLLAFYQQYYVGRNAVVAIVGALNKDEAKQLAEQLVGELPKGKPAAALPEVNLLPQAEVIQNGYPSTQTHILVGQPGMKRGDPDYFDLYVGNHILGGSGFSSRIMKIIRDENGLAYSAYSYFLPMRQEGPFIMGLQTKNDSRDKALALLDKTLREFVEQGPSEDELAHAQMNITGGFPLRIDSNRDIVEYIAMLGFYDLPLDYLSTFNSKVNAVTVASIKDAFARRVDPARLLTVTVGQEQSP